MDSYYVENAWASALLSNTLIRVVHQLKKEDKKIEFSAAAHPSYQDSSAFCIYHNGTESRDNSPDGAFRIHVRGRKTEHESIINIGQRIANAYCEGEIISGGPIDCTITHIFRSDWLKGKKVPLECAEIEIAINYILKKNLSPIEKPELSKEHLAHSELVRIGIRSLIQEMAGSNINLSNGWGLKTPLTDQAYLFDSLGPLDHGGIFSAHICYDSRNKASEKSAFDLAEKIKKQIQTERSIPSPYIPSTIRGNPDGITTENMWGIPNLGCVIIRFSYAL